jgi:mono/diheme cytochrome c family protein
MTYAMKNQSQSYSRPQPPRFAEVEYSSALWRRTQSHHLSKAEAFHLFRRMCECWLVNASAFVIALLWVTWLPCVLIAQTKSGATERGADVAGLIAEYHFGDTVTRRIDEDILFVGHAGQPDARLPQEALMATWRGAVLVRENGKYRFSIYSSGKVSLRVNGQQLIDANSSDRAWHDAEPIELAFGRCTFEMEYASGTQVPSVGLYWAGPGFELEPVASRYLAHTPTAEEIAGDHEEGLSLSRALRCSACHRFPRETGQGQDALLQAPSLVRLAENLRPSWLVSRLVAPADSDSHSNMPHFSMHRNDALAISAALFAASERSSAPSDLKKQLAEMKKKRKKNDPEVRTEPDSAKGEMTFVSTGCIACHSVGDINSQNEAFRFSGGDLTSISGKRTREFYLRWFEDPASVNRHHRMPIFNLSPIERLDLAEYLQSLGADESQNDTRAAGDANRGVGLIQQHRCGACHELPASLAGTVAKTEVRSDSKWEAGCLGEPNWKSAVPGYALTASERSILKDFLLADHTLSFAESGQQLIRENNCLACHARDAAPGIAAQFPALIEELPNLASRLGAIAPPSLSSVGDKLHDAALSNAIALPEKPRRPWLDIRMPKFNFNEQQRTSIVEHFISHDRIPDRLTEPVVIPQGKAADFASSRLVTAEGFGCQSCHQIADSEPLKVALNAHGTDLTMLGDRIRPSWFLRWVRNPARIVPRMEMPAIQKPVVGVLNDSLDQQLAALWKTLNTPGYRPPKPNPVRVVRNFNAPGLAESTHILTDVLEVESEVYLRPLVFGLPNRNNILFDLESGSLKSWWLGDLARQHTRGKSWFWEAGAQPLLSHEDEAVSSFLERLSLVDAAGGTWTPAIVGQVSVEVDRFEHFTSQASWMGRMHLSSTGKLREITISQRLAAQGEAVAVMTRLSGLGTNEQIVIEVGGQVSGAERISADFEGLAHASFVSEDSQLRIADTQHVLVTAVGADTGTVSWTSTYKAKLAADRFPPSTFSAPASMRVDLDCVPGYEAIKLPLPIPAMPISFAWSPSGEMFVGSLKGHVLQAIDSDGDGLEDNYVQISDELPTPYGLHYGEAGLDALAKYALVRLTKPTDGGKIWNTAVIADGWGYTNDYHDWAVGLELDSSGNYYMALPCQQDDRTEAAANLRGHALKLIPNGDSQSPRAYRVESLAAGLRFPMGIALNASEELFTTDNQGNYNPFNELNHLRAGQRYGFINKLENKNGFSPPFESPAINLPHPWTRSVNGICFLRTPAETLARTGQALFGAFEGHLIGCEMNNRVLVRMSLQRVGDTYQGAAYLFSKPPSEGEPALEGPIVCEVSPSGDLIVGSLQDSGWGGGQNTGSVVRLRPTGHLPLGIAEVRANHAGFTIDFTEPVDLQKAVEAKNYSIRSYQRISTPAYGGDDQDERDESLRSIKVSSDGKRVTLELNEFREGFVYELNVAAIGPSDDSLFPSQVHYTLRSIPAEEVAQDQEQTKQ